MSSQAIESRLEGEVSEMVARIIESDESSTVLNQVRSAMFDSEGKVLAVGVAFQILNPELFARVVGSSKPLYTFPKRYVEEVSRAAQEFSKNPKVGEILRPLQETFQAESHAVYRLGEIFQELKGELGDALSSTALHRILRTMFDEIGFEEEQKSVFAQAEAALLDEKGYQFGFLSGLWTRKEERKRKQTAYCERLSGILGQLSVERVRAQGDADRLGKIDAVQRKILDVRNRMLGSLCR